MANTRLREKLDANKPAFGCWLGLGDPALAEMVALAGFDYVNIDMEHTAIDLGKAEDMVRAAHARGISALVRAPGQDENALFRIAEMGADGIYLPHINNAEDARRAVSITKYAPLGNRGMGGVTRAADYGLGEGGLAAHMKRANRNLILWAQIEEKTAVDDIDAIAAVEGIDVCGLAPLDLARSLGVAASKNDPKLMQAARHVAERVRHVGNARLAVPLVVFGAELALELGAVAINVDSVVSALGKALRANLQTAKAHFPAA